MSIIIRSRFYSNIVISEGPEATIKEHVVAAVARNADLRGADLRDADLRDADLRNADLRDADLHGADLHGANLHGADLRDADLHDANLRNADLRNAKLSWQSHDLLAELLRREAGDVFGRRLLAASIVGIREWCWKDFLAAPFPTEDREWAIGVLRSLGAPKEFLP